MTNKLAKKVQATKYSNKPQDLTHKFYEPERLLVKLKNEGKTIDEINNALVEYIESEKQKCADDLMYFANTYGFIIGHGSAGIIPFKSEDYQAELMSSIVTNKYIITVKSRQLGVSTAMMFYCLWFSIFTSGKRTLIVAHKRESAEEFIVKLKTAYEFLPSWLKPSCILYSKNTVEFDTKSTIKAITSNPHAARSFSATLFVLDEAAFIKDADEVVKGLLPTIAASDGKLIALSSPNGNSDQNWFYNTFTYAKNGLNSWKWYEFPWTVSSIFKSNPNFERDQIALDNGNIEKFKQEFSCEFSANTRSIFPPAALQQFKPSDNIINKKFGGLTYDDTFYVWKSAEKNKVYTIGVDCAANKITSKDFSSFQVLDSDTQEQMAEYKGKLTTEIFVDILIKAARHYNDALLIIEENSYSDIVFYLLEQKRYINLWRDPKKNTPGFYTSRTTRPLLIDKLMLFYGNPYNMGKLRSPRLKIEMENFSGNKLYSDGSSKIEASRGSHDDCIMALALALVPLTPKEFIHRPQEDFLIKDAKNLVSGEYSDEYLDYHSSKMGISKAVLKHRLEMFHKIKSGVYDANGLEKINFQHPVEEFERIRATSDFLGIHETMPTESLDDVKSASLLPSDRKIVIEDIFDDKYKTLFELHQSFILSNKLKGF